MPDPIATAADTLEYPPPLPPAIPTPPAASPSLVAAILQVLVCAWVPTQIVVALAMYLAGVEFFSGDHISIKFLAMVELFDTALVAILIRLFLHASGETSAQVFIGPRKPVREIALGLVLIPVLLGGIGGLLWTLQHAAPWLHTVKTNPYQDFLAAPGVFALMVVLAGGVKEELQRAFIIHRFGQRLGGPWVGLIATSVVFGALHADQGVDAALTLMLTGALWGAIYIRRRSLLAPMVSHAGFDLLEVLQAVFLK